MHAHKRPSSGFTLAEILVSLAIIALIFGIGTYVLVNANRQRGLNVLGDTVVSTLEKAKANAMADLNGDSFGVNVGATTGTSSFIYFEGTGYDSRSTANMNYVVPSQYTFFATTTPAGGLIVFNRLSGTPNATGTITVADPNNPAHPQVITVGGLGDITITR